MKKTLVLATLITLLFVKCGKYKDPFLITKDAVGPLTKDIKIQQVDSIFAQDSIVKLNPIDGVIGTQGEVEVYEKGGKKLLRISPFNENDPNSKISNIQFFDERYKTEKNLSMLSTFGDVKANYTIANVETTLTSVVVFLEDSNVYITIEKKQLPENLRYDPSIEIESTQIPEDATFKYFMLGWDYEEPTNKS